MRVKSLNPKHGFKLVTRMHLNLKRQVNTIMEFSLDYISLLIKYCMKPLV